MTITQKRDAIVNEALKRYAEIAQYYRELRDPEGHRGGALGVESAKLGLVLSEFEIKYQHFLAADGHWND